MVDSKMSYHRSFWILEEEDAGFGVGQQPTGYVKLEEWSGKGKLHFSIQNIADSQPRFSYRLLLIAAGAGRDCVVDVGDVHITKNRGELKWEFDPSNVGGKGCRLVDISSAALLTQYSDRNDGIVCPAAAHKDKKNPWKDAIRTWKKAAAASPTETTGTNAIARSSKEQITPAAAPSPSAAEPSIEKSSLPPGPRVIDGAAAGRYGQHLETLVKGGPGDGKPVDQELGVEKVLPGERDKAAEKSMDNIDNTEPDSAPQTACSGPVRQSLAEGLDMTMPGMDSEQEAFIRDYVARNRECMLNQSDTSLQDIGQKLAECTQCKQEGTDNENQGYRRGPLPCDVTALRENLDQYFEKANPFGSRRSNYVWWKVNSPVYLNNILYQCNIRTPLMFNPKVLMAHFKHKHLLMGLYYDRVRKKEYIVCGIPGVYSVDDRPFGELCRWVQVENRRNRFGAFGYWLVYIDPKEGKFLKVN